MDNEQHTQHHSRRRRIVSQTYRGYPLGNEDGYDAVLLNGMLNTLDDSLDRHSRVLLKRVDLHLPQDTPLDQCKSLLSETTAEIVRNFNRSRKRGVAKPRPALDPHYFMTIEQNESALPHAHALMTFNGNAIRKGYYPMQEMKAIVQRKLGNAALLHECENGEFLLHRGNKAEMAEAVRAASYLCKVRTKEHNQGREMMRSRRLRRKD